MKYIEMQTQVELEIKDTLNKLKTKETVTAEFPSYAAPTLNKALLTLKQSLEKDIKSTATLGDSQFVKAVKSFELETVEILLCKLLNECC
jgi:hypothetical protein